MAFLQAITIPERGGDTMWANLYTALDALSPAMQGVVPLAVGRAHREPGDRRRVPAALCRRRSRREGHGGVPDPSCTRWCAPIRRPDATRLFVAGAFMTGIDGMHDDDSAVLLTFLNHLIENPNFHTRWSWRPGDLAIWDERCTNHRALSDHYPQYRQMRRCTVKAIGPCSTRGVHPERGRRDPCPDVPLLRVIDAGDVDGLVELFADVVLGGFEGTCGNGRAVRRSGRCTAARDDAKRTAGTWRTKHITTNVLIDVDEDAGTGAPCSYWVLLTSQAPNTPITISLAGSYHDRFAVGRRAVAFRRAPLPRRPAGQRQRVAARFRLSAIQPIPNSRIALPRAILWTRSSSRSANRRSATSLLCGHVPSACG